MSCCVDDALDEAQVLAACSSSQSAMMNTRLTYSCTPTVASRLNRSNGACDGMNSSAWYSKVPSAFIGMTSSGSSQACAMCL